MTEVERKKLVFYLDGLRYSFQMANLATARLREMIDEIAQCYSKDEYTENQITSCLLDAWMFVDICHRVRELVQQVPGLSQKIPGIQIFLRGTEHIENLRNYVQHFRSGIPNIPLQSNPLWGVLSWTPTNDKTVCYTIFSGNLMPGVSGYSLPLDTHSSKFVDSVKLVANGIEIDFGIISEQLDRIKKCISEWLDQLPNVQRLKGKTMITKFGPITSPKANL
jgi:hypothetical protein